MVWIINATFKLVQFRILVHFIYMCICTPLDDPQVILQVAESLHTLYKSFKFNISYYICTLFFNIWGHVSCIDVLYRWYPATEWDSEVWGGDVTDPTEAVWAGSGAGQHATTEPQVSPIQSVF